MWALRRFHHLVLLVRHPKVEPGHLHPVERETDISIFRRI